MVVIKKDGTEQAFNIDKVIAAVSKSAERVMHEYTEDELNLINNTVTAMAVSYAAEHNDKIPISQMHIFAEKALDTVDQEIGKSYRDYRNYKTEFRDMMDKVYKKSQSIRYIGDNSNANTDATMVSTQRSLIYGYLNKELYQKFFLNVEERQAANDGYIYIHDMKDRLDGINCQLFNMSEVLKGGFSMGNQFVNEPKSLDVVFDVISDITMNAASQEYGGYTIPRVDTILAPYAQKSYDKYYQEYLDITDSCKSVLAVNKLEELADSYAEKKVCRDFEQGFQSWDVRFNTVGSSRGDYPFIAISLGIDTSRWGKLATEVCLKVRTNGQGKPGYIRTVLFPKITFLYDENLHGPGKELEYLFDIAIECSKKNMYPDFLSLTGEGYIPSMYKKYGQVVSLMGRRDCSSIKNSVNDLANRCDNNDRLLQEMVA